MEKSPESRQNMSIIIHEILYHYSCRYKAVTLVTRSLVFREIWEKPVWISSLCPTSSGKGGSPWVEPMPAITSPEEAGDVHGVSRFDDRRLTV